MAVMIDRYVRTYLVPFLRRVVQHPHIIVHVKAEQWSRLSSSLVHNKVVESVMLEEKGVSSGFVQFGAFRLT